MDHLIMVRAVLADLRGRGACGWCFASEPNNPRALCRKGAPRRGLDPRTTPRSPLSRMDGCGNPAGFDEVAQTCVPAGCDELRQSISMASSVAKPVRSTFERPADLCHGVARPSKPASPPLFRSQASTILLPVQRPARPCVPRPSRFWLRPLALPAPRSTIRIRRPQQRQFTLPRPPPSRPVL